jgi:hypothetical protein
MRMPQRCCPASSVDHPAYRASNARVGLIAGREDAQSG